VRRECALLRDSTLALSLFLANSLKEREFVAAARASGETSFRIVFAEVLPNEVALVASTFVGTFVYAVGAEIALEFLGLGDISQASWGEILFWAQNNGALIIGKWWQFVPAGLCVALLCASLAFINFGIDELANPRLRTERPPRSRHHREWRCFYRSLGRRQYYQRLSKGILPA